MKLDLPKLQEEIQSLYRSEHEAMGERGTLVGSQCAIERLNFGDLCSQPTLLGLQACADG